jgi:hypothetical protein
MTISRIITGDESWFYGYDPGKKKTAIVAVEEPPNTKSKKGAAHYSQL